MQKPQGNAVIIISLLVASWLSIFPMPETAVSFRPAWVLMVLVFWVIEIPHRVGVWWGFFVGLYLDVLLGSPVGVQALSFAVIAYVALVLHKRIRVFPIVQQSAIIFIFVGVFLLANHFVLSAIGDAGSGKSVYWLSCLSSAVLWPWISGSQKYLRQRFLIR